MRRVIGGLVSALLLSLGLWACGGGTSSPTGASTVSTNPPAPTVASVAVTGTAPTIGGSTQFAANASMSNGTMLAVTSQATWQSSATNVATVGSSGLVAGVAPGEADITATYQSIAGKMHVVLVPAAVTVTGTVTDAASRAVLAGIIVAGGGKSTTTDSSGRYSITVNAGGIGLVASGTGYVTAEKILTITADTRVDFSLVRQAPPPPPPTPGPIAAPGLPARTPVGSNFKCSLSDIVHPSSCINSSFGDATAICGDGARSCSTSSSGTCSSHINVYCFVCPGALCPQ